MLTSSPRAETTARRVGVPHYRSPQPHLTTPPAVFRWQSNLLRPIPDAPLRISRTFHFIWVGPKPRTDFEESMIASWRRHHPHWNIKIWADEDLTWLSNRSLFEAATSPAEKADIARLEVLYREGGVYVDTDFECFLPIEPLLAGQAGVVGSENGVLITNALLAFEAGHPFLGDLISTLPKYMDQHAEAPPNIKTGPIFWTSQAVSRASFASVAVAPPDTFYPYLYNELAMRTQCRYEGVYAAHHWTGSWLDTPRHHQIYPNFLIDVQATPGVSQKAISELVGRISGRTAGWPRIEVRAERSSSSMRDDVPSGSLAASESFWPSTEPDTEEHGPRYLRRGHLRIVVHGDSWTVPRQTALETALAEITQMADTYGRPAIAAALGEEAGHGKTVTLGEIHQTDSCKDTNIVQNHPAPPTAVYIGDHQILCQSRQGLRYIVDSRDLSLMPELVIHGEYEVGLTNFILRYPLNGKLAVDAGANFGLFTLLMAAKVGPHGKVAAVEPDPRNLKLLHQNVALNYLQDRVEVIECAASQGTGRTSLHVSESFFGNGYIPTDGATGHLMAGKVREIDVATLSLDDIIGGRHVGLMKIDTEGAEPLVFAGMPKAILEGRIECICFELIADYIGNGWPQFIEFLTAAESIGWTFGVLADDGQLIEAAVAQLAAARHVTNAVMISPRSVGLLTLTS